MARKKKSKNRGKFSVKALSAETSQEYISTKEVIDTVKMMFRHIGASVEELLSYYSNDNVERLACTFFDIVTNKNFIIGDDMAKVAVKVDKNLVKPLEAMLNLLLFDAYTDKMVNEIVSPIFKPNNK